MLTVTDCVRQIVKKSPFIYEPLSKGWLNLSQYASSIKSEVEELNHGTSVQLGSIITALGRVRNEVSETFSVQLFINDISLKFPITEFNFAFHPKHASIISNLYSHFTDIENSFLNIISGNTETSIFINSQHAEEVLKIFSNQKPNLELPNLGAVSVKFNQDYLQTVGGVYYIFKSLVWHKVNIIEVVSTYTELTLVVRKVDMQIVFDVISSLVEG